MKHSITVFGPQGSGKTRNAEALKKHFGMTCVWDEGTAAPKSKPCEFETLILQVNPPDDLSRAVHIDFALSLIAS